MTGPQKPAPSITPAQRANAVVNATRITAEADRLNAALMMQYSSELDHWRSRMQMRLWLMGAKFVGMALVLLHFAITPDANGQRTAYALLGLTVLLLLLAISVPPTPKIQSATAEIRKVGAKERDSAE